MEYLPNHAATTRASRNGCPASGNLPSPTRHASSMLACSHAAPGRPRMRAQRLLTHGSTMSLRRPSRARSRIVSLQPTARGTASLPGSGSVSRRKQVLAGSTRGGGGACKDTHRSAKATSQNICSSRPSPSVLMRHLRPYCCQLTQCRYCARYVCNHALPRTWKPYSSLGGNLQARWDSTPRFSTQATCLCWQTSGAPLPK